MRVVYRPQIINRSMHAKTRKHKRACRRRLSSTPLGPSSLCAPFKRPWDSLATDNTSVPRVADYTPYNNSTPGAALIPVGTQVPAPPLPTVPGNDPNTFARQDSVTPVGTHAPTPTAPAVPGKGLNTISTRSPEEPYNNFAPHAAMIPVGTQVPAPPPYSSRQ